MNKIIIVLFAVLSLSACKNPNKEMKDADQTVAENLPADTFIIPPTPTFQDQASQNYVTAYDAFLIEYKAAVKADDKIRLQELGNKMVGLSTQGVDALKNLTGEESAKLSEYMQTRASQFSRISSGIYKNSN